MVEDSRMQRQKMVEEREKLSESCNFQLWVDFTIASILRQFCLADNSNSNFD